MKVIVCVDDCGGMMFNHRRQSQDRVLKEDILNNLNGSRLWMNAYSAKMFLQEENPLITVDEDFLQKAQEEDFCFVENLPLSAMEEKISEVILYHWNRKYPSDQFFDLDLSEHWMRRETVEFPGSSHEKITKESYLKCPPDTI